VTTLSDQFHSWIYVGNCRTGEAQLVLGLAAFWTIGSTNPGTGKSSIQDCRGGRPSLVLSGYRHVFLGIGWPRREVLCSPLLTSLDLMVWTGTDRLPLPFTQLTSANHLFQSIYDRRVAHRRYLPLTSAVTAWLSSGFKTVTSFSFVQTDIDPTSYFRTGLIVTLRSHFFLL